MRLGSPLDGRICGQTQAAVPNGALRRCRPPPDRWGGPKRGSAGRSTIVLPVTIELTTLALPTGGYSFLLQAVYAN
jgi:hypothetical protein